MLTATIKNKIVKEAIRHEKLDAFVQGAYEKRNGATKHCSIGCVRASLGLDATIGEHGDLVDPTGVPEFILILSDHLFEGLPKDNAALWTRRLWMAIPEGKDLAPACAKIMTWLARDLEKTAIRKDVRECAKRNAELYASRGRGKEPSGAEWGAARQQAYAARQQADAAWQQAGAARQKFWERLSDAIVRILKNM